MLENIIGSLVISVINIYIWNRLLNQKLSFKNYKLYIGFLAMLILLIIIFFSVNSIIKSLFVVIMFTLVVIYMYGIRLKQSIVLAFYTQILYIISEVSVIILLLIVTNIQNKIELAEVFSGTIYANIIISLFVFVIIHISAIRNMYDKIIYLTRREKIKNTIIVIFIVAITASILFNFIFYTNNLILLSFIGILLLVVFLIFLMKGIIMRNNYLNMYSKYNSTLETLKSYEDILDKFKVNNHENKNQLLMIRNMLGKSKEKEISKYIDKIVKNEYEDDENLIMETSKIPSGGLRALIYSKILYMKNNNISFDLKVDRNLRRVQLVDLEQNLILDICKIIGVFLDNAIDETEKIIMGSISVELYATDNTLNISIANIFEGFIDLDKIDEEKYTTKGNGHGYGLSLVRKIINNNSNLENLKMINDNVFIQILKVKI